MWHTTCACVRQAGAVRACGEVRVRACQACSVCSVRRQMHSKHACKRGARESDVAWQLDKLLWRNLGVGVNGEADKQPAGQATNTP